MADSPPLPRTSVPRESESEASPLPLMRRRPTPACGSTRTLLWRASASFAAARGAAAQLPPLALSEALRRGLGSIGSGRSAFVQCHITRLDAPLGPVLAGTRTLLLSRNALRSLLGLPAPLWRQLNSLSVAHNVLDDLALFAFLAAAAPQLSALTLEGNPLCELLDARTHAAAVLPQLRMFDGREVTAAERAAAVLAVRGWRGQQPRWLG